mmetsp:Transcript_13261/g.56042  ORF Transcript_13261/g.56042 Transcript_13261/m.56042 type:complete len:301 (-) Transcript_13261:836-1738(-)
MDRRGGGNVGRPSRRTPGFQTSQRGPVALRATHAVERSGARRRSRVDAARREERRRRRRVRRRSRRRRRRRICRRRRRRVYGSGQPRGPERPESHPRHRGRRRERGGGVRGSAEGRRDAFGFKREGSGGDDVFESFERGARGGGKVGRARRFERRRAAVAAVKDPAVLDRAQVARRASRPLPGLADAPAGPEDGADPRSERILFQRLGRRGGVGRVGRRHRLRVRSRGGRSGDGLVPVLPRRPRAHLRSGFRVCDAHGGVGEARGSRVWSRRRRGYRADFSGASSIGPHRSRREGRRRGL